MKTMTIASTDIMELVQVNNEQVVTNSLKVADVFEKEHRHVLDSIRQILAAENSAARFFCETGGVCGESDNDQRTNRS